MLFQFICYGSLRKSSSDLSCKSFTEIVGSGAGKKPSMSSGGGVKKILDRKLKATDGCGGKSTYKSIVKEVCFNGRSVGVQH